MLNVALFGLGRWGLRLSEALRGSDRIRIVCGASRERARDAAYSAQYGMPVRAWSDVLADPAVARSGAVI